MSILKKIFNYIILGLIFILLINLSRDVWKLWHADETIKRARQKLEEERAKNKELEEKRVSQDEFFLEEQIRNRLGMAKPEEIIVILPEELAITTEEEKQKSKQELANWEKWLSLLLRGGFGKIDE